MLKGLLSELDYSQIQPTPLDAKNTSVIRITTNYVYHERINLIEVDFHSIKEAYDHEIITLSHASTYVQLSYILTKYMTR